MFGRRRIYCDADVIDAGNIVEIIADAMVVHQKNAKEIENLRRYLAGDQPILYRTKKIREDINNKVVVNIASQIMNFKSSYIFSQPLNITKTANADTATNLTPLFRMMDEQRKNAVDQEVAFNFLLCGLGYRGVLINPEQGELSPFCMVSMRPETTFVVRKNDVFGRVALGVSYIKKLNGTVQLTAYTDHARFELVGDSNSGSFKLVGESPNGIGRIPIVCYEMPELMGVFEKAIPLLEAYNVAASNRVDDLEQFIQSILWISGVDLDEDAMQRLKSNLCLLTPNVQDGAQPQVKFLVNNLDQNGIQTMMDDLYSHILSITACPARAQASGGNTGTAIEQGASGYRECQYAAEQIIAAWQKCDRDMYRTVLSILERSSKTPKELRGLKATELETKISVSRNNDLLSKSQALTTLVQCGIAPRLAIQTVNLFADPEMAYEESKSYLEKALERMNASKQNETVADEKRRGDVTNQPKSNEALEQAANGRGTVQKN